MDTGSAAESREPVPDVATAGAPRGRHVLLFALLMLLALTNGVLFAVVTPPWQAPDEPQHYQTIRVLIARRRIPQYGYARSATALHEEVLDSLADNDFWALRHHTPAPETGGIRNLRVLDSEGMLAAVNHPPVYYVLAALAIRPFLSSSIVTQLYVLRLFSVLMGLVAVAAVYVVGGWLSPGRPARVWAATAFVALLPMHAFISAALNNDALAEMLAALVFVLLSALWVHGLSAAQTIGLPVLVLLALFTKRTDIFLVPLAVGTLLAYCWFRTRASGSMQLADARGTRALGWLLVGLAAILTACIGVLLCDVLWWHWWGITARLHELGGLVLNAGIALRETVGFLQLGFAGFWGNFGWLNVPLDVPWYSALALLSLVTMLGGLKGAYRLARAGAVTAAGGMWLVCVLALLGVFAQSAVSVLVRQIPLQGRYLFPALVPIALCFTWGVFEWVPQRRHRLLLVLWIAWWVVFDWVAMFGYVLPHYYG